MKVDNAIIMAAGTSSRFVPLSYEKHKALTVVKGEVLIERQIEQLIEAGISNIYIVTGYKAEQFDYLKDKYGIESIYNKEYLTRNNNGSIWCVKEIVRNSYICSSDNYFAINPFNKTEEEAFYAAEYAEGHTNEWCMQEDEGGYINHVTIGGENSWFMMGHVFWDESFSKHFISILENEYNLQETKNKLWEKIFMDHLDVLKMKIRRYQPNQIYEFDSLDDLRKFDSSYYLDSRSQIMKNISERMNVEEKDIVDIKPINREDFNAVGFEFECKGNRYTYTYSDKNLIKKD